ncbi:MAG: hypothetical protein LBU60_05195 [Clostridiales bacterium]|nr:hypothetical protein [Clostridiales bacterium]
MSSNDVKNRKELSKVRVYGSSEVWERNKYNKWQFKKGIRVIGKVDINLSSMVLKANKKGYKTEFVEDVANLSKKTKNEIIDCFYDKTGKRTSKDVVYLVKE